MVWNSFPDFFVSKLFQIPKWMYLFLWNLLTVFCICPAAQPAIPNLIRRMIEESASQNQNRDYPNSLHSVFTLPLMTLKDSLPYPSPKNSQEFSTRFPSILPVQIRCNRVLRVPYETQFTSNTASAWLAMPSFRYHSQNDWEISFSKSRFAIQRFFACRFQGAQNDRERRCVSSICRLSAVADSIGPLSPAPPLNLVHPAQQRNIRYGLTSGGGYGCVLSARFRGNTSSRQFLSNRFPILWASFTLRFLPVSPFPDVKKIQVPIARNGATPEYLAFPLWARYRFLRTLYPLR